MLIGHSFNMASTFSFLFLFFAVAFSACPNHCSGHGHCGINNLCSCAEGFIGPDCSLRSCPFGPAWTDYASDVDVAHSNTECSNRGRCDRTKGVCICQNGFEGRSCNRMSCPNDCSGHGTCKSMRFHANSALYNSYTYTSIWDADMIFGCVCDNGYEGYDCSLRSCPTGDDSLTIGQVNEVQVLQCTATAGTFTVTFRGGTTQSVPYDATISIFQSALQALPTITAVSISYSTGISLCTGDGSNIVSIEFTQEFGDLPEIIVSTTSLTGTIVVASNGDSISAVDSVQGTKEDAVCSGRGKCDHSTGICSCFTGYSSSDGLGDEGTRGDCGYATGISSCPGATAQCSASGVCGASYVCSCNFGFQAGDCSERLCPSGKAWFDLPTANNVAHGQAECSNMGICNRVTGVCSCHSGFTGSSCERVICPGNPECSGHGVCKSMSDLATLTRVNGVPTPTTYGDTPNDPATWDYDMMFGCHCDNGWIGYDCSLRSCPTGDDPHTRDQEKEVQTITCKGDGGSFRLTFRGETTSSISVTASQAQVKSALEALSEIGKVTVAFDTGIVACADTLDGVEISVTFDSEFGDLPLMEVDFSSMTRGGDPAISADLFAEETTKGTKEDVTCSNRGICNYSTGVCSCFRGYQTSDGDGGEGARGDCGHIIPYPPLHPSLAAAEAAAAAA